MIWYFVIAAVVILIDQLSKWSIVHQLELNESIPVIGEFFQITSHRNKGAAFGILQDQRTFFIIVTIIIVVGLIWYLHQMWKEKRILLCTALSLVLGGALGNFIDRARTGEVVDFFKFRFQFDFFGTPVDYIFPIFNVADSAIVIGVALIFLDMIISWRKERQEAVN